MRDKIADKQRLQHILKAISELESFVEGVTFEDFAQNRMMQQACVSNIMIVGEASGHLTIGIKEKYNSVDWTRIKGLRNIIVHEYFKVDIPLTWQIIHHNLSELKSVSEQALKEFEETNN